MTEERTRVSELSSDALGEMTKVSMVAQIAELKNMIEEKDEKIWQLETSLEIERDIGDKVEDLLKTEQQRYLDATSALEVLRKSEAIKTQQVAKCQEMVHKLQTGKKVFEKRHGKAEQMLAEKDNIKKKSKHAVEDMKKQLESQNKELVESKKALEEVTTVAQAARKRASICTNELQKCQTLTGELKRQIEILETESKKKLKEAKDGCKQSVGVLPVFILEECELAELEELSKELELEFNKMALDIETENVAGLHNLQELNKHLQDQDRQDKLTCNTQEAKEEILSETQQEELKAINVENPYNLSLDDFENDMTSASVENQIIELKNEIKDKDDKIHQLRTDLKTEKEKNEELEKMLKSEQERCLHIAGAHEIIKKKGNFEAEQLHKVQETVRKLQGENKDLIMKQDEKYELIKEKDKVIDELKNATEELRQHLNKTNREVTKTKKALEEKIAVAELESKRAATLANELEKVRNFKSELQHQIEILETELKIKADEAADERKEKEEELKVKNSIIVEKENKITELEELPKKLEFKFSDERIKREKQLEETLSVIARKEIKINELESKLRKTEQYTESEIAACSNKLQELTTQLENQEKEKKIIQQNLEQEKGYSKELQEILNELKKKTFEKEMELQKMDQLYNLLENQKFQTNELKNEIKIKDSAYEDLQKQLENKNTFIKSQTNKVELLEKSINEREMSIDKLHVQLEKIQVAKNETDNRLKQVEEASHEVSMQLDEKQRENRSSHETISKLQTDILQLESELNKQVELAKIRERNLLLEKESSIQSLKDLQSQFESEKKTYTSELQEKEKVANVLQEEMAILRSEAVANDLILTLNEQKTDLPEKLKGKRLKDVKDFLENYSLKLNELEENLKEKECECDHLKRELEGKNNIIDNQINKIDILEKRIAEKESSVGKINEELVYFHEARGEGENRIKQLEEEKLEISLQLQEELRREKRSNKRFIDELRSDIRDMESQLDYEKQSASRAEKEMKAMERKMLLEKETLIQNFEDLKLQFDSEKILYHNEKKKLDGLKVKANEMEITYTAQLNSMEDVCRSLQNENVALHEQIKEYEDLQKQLEIKDEMLFAAETKFEELLRNRENDTIEIERIVEENSFVVENLREELLESKAKIENNSLQEESHYAENLGKIELNCEIKNLTLMAIEQAKRDIEKECDLKAFVRELTETKEMSRMDEGDRNVTGESTNCSITSLNMGVPFVVLILTLFCLYLRFEFFIIVSVAITIPLVYGFARGAVELYKVLSLKESLRKEKIRLRSFKDVMIQLVKQLAVERTLTDCLTKTVEGLAVQASKLENSITSHLREFISLKERKMKIDRELQRRQTLIEKLQAEIDLDIERKTALEDLKRLQQDDIKHVEHLQNVIDKLEILIKKNSKKRLDFFYMYEELKKAIDTMREKRINEQLLNEKHENRKIDVYVRDVNEKGWKLSAALLVFTGISAAILAHYSQSSSAKYALLSSLIFLFCSVVSALTIWKKAKDYESYINFKTKTTSERVQEIKELTALLEEEHKVIAKQREAIRALETKLKVEYEKKQNITSDLTQNISKPANAKENDKLSFCEEAVDEEGVPSKSKTPRGLQRQVSELNKEQQGIVDNLKNAASHIMSLSLTQQEFNREKFQVEEQNKTKVNVFEWKSVAFILMCSIIATVFAWIKMYRIAFSVVFMLIGFILPAICHYMNTWIQNANLNKLETKRKKTYNIFAASARQTVYEVIFSLIVISAEISIQLPKTFLRGIFSFLVLLASLIYRRKLCDQIVTKDKTIEELTEENNERRQLCEIYCEELETVKKLLVLERSWKQYTVCKRTFDESSLNTKAYDNETIKLMNISEDISSKLETLNGEKNEVNELQSITAKNENGELRKDAHMKVQNLGDSIISKTPEKAKAQLQNLRERREFHQVQLEKLKTELEEKLRSRNRQLKTDLENRESATKEEMQNLEDLIINRVFNPNVDVTDGGNNQNKLLVQMKKKCEPTIDPENNLLEHCKSVEVVVEKDSCEETGNRNYKIIHVTAFTSYLGALLKSLLKERCLSCLPKIASKKQFLSFITSQQILSQVTTFYLSITHKRTIEDLH